MAYVFFFLMEVAMHNSYQAVYAVAKGFRNNFKCVDMRFRRSCNAVVVDLPRF